MNAFRATHQAWRGQDAISIQPVKAALASEPPIDAPNFAGVASQPRNQGCGDGIPPLNLCVAPDSAWITCITALISARCENA